MDWDELISTSALIDLAYIIVLCGIGAVFLAVRKTGARGWLSEEFESDTAVPRSVLQHTWLFVKRDGGISEWDGFALLGIFEGTLVIASALPSPLRRSNIRIPLDLLDKVGARRHMLFALKQFDQFKIRGAGCSIYIPSGTLRNMPTRVS